MFNGTMLLKPLLLQNNDIFRLLGNYVLYELYNAEEITLPSTLTKIGEGFMKGSSVKNVVIPARITRLLFTQRNSLHTSFLQKMQTRHLHAEAVAAVRQAIQLSLKQTVLRQLSR